MKTFCALILSMMTLFVFAGPTLALDEDGSQAYVMQFGAKGDGVNDDTAAFQQAIQQVQSGGLVVIPQGTFKISSTIVITKPVTIMGTGFATQIYNNTDQTLFQLVGVSNAAIRDVYLGSNSTKQGVSLIELVNSGHNQINNVTMLGGYYGLHLKGSLINTIIDLRSGVNFGGFFAPTSTTNTWVMAEAYNGISANANTFIAPVLEGGTNGIVLTDGNGQGSLHVFGGTIEGVSGTGVTFQNMFLPSSITGVHFEANKVADIVLQAATNVRISSIVSSMPINLIGDTRNVSITDSAAQTIHIDMGTYNGVAPGAYPLGNGAKRILLQNITAWWAACKLDISPAPAFDPNIGMPNGPSSPVIPNPGIPGENRMDIVYNNIGAYCGGG